MMQLAVTIAAAAAAAMPAAAADASLGSRGRELKTLWSINCGWEGETCCWPWVKFKDNGGCADGFTCNAWRKCEKKAVCKKLGETCDPLWKCCDSLECKPVDGKNKCQAPAPPPPPPPVCKNKGETCDPLWKCCGSLECKPVDGKNKCQDPAPPCGGNQGKCCPYDVRDYPCNDGLKCIGKDNTCIPPCGTKGDKCCDLLWADKKCEHDLQCGPDNKCTEPPKQCTGLEGEDCCNESSKNGCTGDLACSSLGKCVKCKTCDQC